MKLPTFRVQIQDITERNSMQVLKAGLSVPQLTGLGLGVLGFVMPFFVTISGLSYAGHIALSIFLLAAFFWMLEPIPIHATSLLVILMGVLLLSGSGLIFKGLALQPGETADVTHKLFEYKPGRAADYIATLAHPIIILFLGGFMIADAAVKYNFDKNLTRFLLRPFGSKPLYILLGLMLVTAILSAFMSNTATTAMMMTVIIPIMAQMKKDDQFKTGLALSIPVAANIGGIATPIGTPPNAIVVAAAARQGFPISFTEWMEMALPLVIVLLLFAWWLLRKLFPPQIEHFQTQQKAAFDRSPKAWVFYSTFTVTLILWVTESVHGLSSNLVALIPITVLSMFSVLVPSDIRKLPWEVLWLVSGGIALGIYMDDTGLANWMVGLIDWNLLSGTLIIVLFAAVAITMSNFMSNTVTATLLMPLAITIGINQGDGGLNPTLLALIIGIGTSMAMVLPISTPPNAIAMATGMVKTKDMAKTGIIIGVIGLAVMLSMALLYWNIILD